MEIPREEGVLKESTFFSYIPSVSGKRVFLYPLYIGHYQTQTGYYLRRNRYDSLLLLFTCGGSGTIETGSGKYILSPGEAMILDCYAPHSYYPNKSWDFYWLHFDGSYAMEYYQYLTENVRQPATIKEPLEFINTWRNLRDLMKSHPAFSEPMMSKYITDLLTLFASSGSVQGSSKTVNGIDCCLTYINRHLEEHLPLDKLAGLASLSPYHFSRCFKAATGYTPHEYILTGRLDLARFYLKTTSDTIKKIAYSCGFQSEHSFCTAFKKYTGYTPTEFRNK